MKLTFLGTRGYIEPRSERHAMHSSLMISYYHTDVVIDCGEDWLGKVDSWKADAIFVTHAHPDHAGGLAQGAPCPVYATEDAWETMDSFDLRERKVVSPRHPLQISHLVIEAFPVEHSTRAPAVGYRVTAGRVTVFYVPDVVWIRDRAEALRGAQVYIGDAATVTRSMVRKIEGSLIGHTPLRTQLTWCQKEGVPHAIFTHCGSEVVSADPQELRAEVDALAEERGVEVEIAYDGMEVVLR